MKRVRNILSAVRERRLRPGPSIASGSTVGGGEFYVQGVLGHYGGPGLTLMDFIVLASVIVVAALWVEVLRSLM
ncbi:MAG: hypothetical protein M3071_08025, partial [Actinomycetota bacterium]|nr:hypothetical protein [Actinomycetota bacterium]